MSDSNSTVETLIFIVCAGTVALCISVAVFAYSYSIHLWPDLVELAKVDPELARLYLESQND